MSMRHPTHVRSERLGEDFLFPLGAPWGAVLLRVLLAERWAIKCKACPGGAASVLWVRCVSFRPWHRIKVRRDAAIASCFRRGHLPWIDCDRGPSHD